MSAQLDVRQAGVAYGGKPVVEEVSFDLRTGDIGCLLGPSGCGKTSLLRAIAGFEPISAGQIHLHGRCVARPGMALAPEKRRVGMVFQDFALYPHLNVEKNVAFGLRRMGKVERGRRVADLLRLVGLGDMGAYYPHQLSGGQQQRVALIRAMAPRPDILLLDEPFSGLDVELRAQLAREVRQILKRDGITAILVTHDQLEAFAMADYIGVLGEGRLRQWAGGYELYHRPVDRFVADFIGQGAMLPGTVIDTRAVETALGRVEGRLPEKLTPGSGVEVLLRPDDLVPDDASPLRLEVVEKVFRGAEYLYTFKLSDGGRLLCLAPSHQDYPIGDRVGVRLDIGHLVAFPRRSLV